MLDKLVFYLATNIIAISEEIKLITISNHKFVSNNYKIHLVLILIMLEI